MIRLLYEHGGYAVGSVIELDGNVEATLISMGKAEKHNGPATNKKVDPDAKPPKDPPPPKPLTPIESMEALVAHLRSLQQLIALGTKSELDKMPQKLQEVIDWIECNLDGKRHNPRSVPDIYEPQSKEKVKS